MSKDSKLHAMRTACEVEEQAAIEAKNRVDAVVRERQDIVGMLLNQQRKLAEKLKNLTSEQRSKALLAGDALQLAAITQYAQKLKQDTDNLSAKLKERSQELETALVRARLADEELIKARVEKKKLDKLIENWQQSELRRSVALDELNNDELSHVRRGK